MAILKRVSERGGRSAVRIRAVGARAVRRWRLMQAGGETDGETEALLGMCAPYACCTAVRV